MKARIKLLLALFILLNFVLLDFTGCAALSPASFDIDSISSYRDIPGVTEEEIAAIEALKATRHTFYYGSEPSTEVFKMQDGSSVGFTVMFLALLSDLFDIPFEQVLYNWESLQNGIDSMRIDFTGDFNYTPEQAKRYFMTNPIAGRSLAVFTSADNQKFETEYDLNNLRVGFLEGSPAAQTIMYAYPSLNFTIINSKSSFEMVGRLKYGSIDAFIDDAVFAHYYDRFTFIHAKELFSMAYSQVSLTTANPELAPVISVVNKYLAAGGIDKLTELYKEGNSLYAKDKFNRSLTGEEQAYLASLKESGAKVNLALQHDNYPISFYNEQEKEFQGMAPDILAEISAVTGISFNLVTHKKDTSWQEILEMLRTGEAAMVSELQYTEARKDSFLWSDTPYATTRFALISKTGLPYLDPYQLINVSVGVVKDSAYEEIFDNWFPNNSKTVRFNDQDEAVAALEGGHIDLLMLSEYGLLTLTHFRESPDYKVNIYFTSPIEESFFGFHINETILCSIISKAQRYLHIDRIEKDWTVRVYDYSIKYAIERLVYLYISATILVVLLIIMIVLLVNNARNKTNLEMQVATISTIYNSIPDLLFCKDPNCTYTNCNQSMEHFLGLSEAEIIGKGDMEIFGHDEKMAQRFIEIDKKVLNNNTAIMVEELVIAPDNTQKLFETIRSPLIQNGETIGLLAISRDITDHKAALEAADEASRAKSSFLAQMSHEIRTPLNTIIGMNELILQEDISKKACEYAALAKQAGTNMLAIINDILDFSKIEAGKLEISPAAYEFSSLINDVISLTRMRIKEKLIMLTVNVDSNIPNLLIGDEIRVKEIFLNLLSNAVKYTDEGFISFKVTCEIHEDNVVLTAAVSDSGMGIKEENIANLFETFFRVNTQKMQGREGTGLGLAIVKRLCCAMGGDVWVESEYGAGSTFTVTVPQKVESFEKLAKVEKPRKKSVLLYEPRLIYAKSLADTLNDLGVRCVLTVSRQEFYNALEKETFPFIFISSVLYETESRLAQLESTSKLVVITEFADTLLVKNARVITMPAYSPVIANILNDTSDMENYYSSEKSHAGFIAPLARVLIVDDLSTNLTVAEGLMSQYKMQIDTCKSGMESIELVKNNRYDIIFMDHAMPEMDGIEATAAIRALEDDSNYYQEVPIIALTANAVSGMREIFLQNHMNDFLAKPIEIMKLNNILRKWIPEEKQEQAKKTDNRRKEKAFIPIEIAGLDTQLGLSLNGGMADNYLKTLAVFYRDGTEKVNEIRQCLKNNDMKLYTTLVHGLKSATMNIGAKKLSDFAKALEKAGKSGADMFIMNNTETFLTQLTKLLEDIKVAIVVPADEKEVLEVQDMAYLKKSFAKMKPALENMEAGPINSIMRSLESKTWDKKHNEAIRKLSAYILLYEYDEAIALIDGMLD